MRTLLIWLLLSMMAHASPIVINEPNIEGYSLNQWCHAIYMAEGGSKTTHPYGILAKYKHTTPLQACRNTVLHKYHNWQSSHHEPFVSYLGARYCPVGASNDPGGLNRNWVRNVKYYLNKEQ